MHLTNKVSANINITDTIQTTAISVPYIESSSESALLSRSHPKRSATATEIINTVLVSNSVTSIGKTRRIIKIIAPMPHTLLIYPTDDATVRRVSPTEPPTIGMIFEATSFAALDDTVSAADESAVCDASVAKRTVIISPRKNT